MSFFDIFQPLGHAALEVFDDTRSWVDPNGYRLSDRLWLAKQADRQAVDNLLLRSIALGDSPLTTAKKLEAYLTPLGLATSTNRPENTGTGNYAARRLARTETSRAFEQAGRQASDLNPFVDRRKYHLSGSHPEPDVCDQLAADSSPGEDPGVYALAEFPSPPRHPHCLCYGTPVLRDDSGQVLAQMRQDIRDFREDNQPPEGPDWTDLFRLVQVSRWLAS